MKHQLKTFDNPSADAYRQHLSDRSCDYYLKVQNESKAARSSLKRKARAIALKRKGYSASALLKK